MTGSLRTWTTTLCALTVLPASAVAQEETQTLSGTLVACYAGQDLSNEEHVACANLCIALAVPTVLLAQDGHPYVPTDAKDKDLSKHTNQLVELEGLVGEQAGCRTIAVERLKAVDADETERGGGAHVFGSRDITGEDLADLRTMSLYELFRQHPGVRFVRGPDGGEIMLCEDRVGGAGLRGCVVFVNDRQATGDIATLRSIYTDEVERLEILRSSEASNRFGGDGWDGAIVIHTK